MDFNLGADISQANQAQAKAAQKQPTRAETVNKEAEVAQANLNGLQWSATQNQAAVQAQAQTQGTNKTELQANKNFEITAPSIEDLAVLSSVDTSDKVHTTGKLNLVRLGFNMGALEQAFRETYKKSKSHNFLLERFMANVKFSSLKLLFSALGVPAAEQDKIQSEVREEALKEIHNKLNQEWAYTKAMLEIVG